MENFKETKEKGFTLIELLVVISIIALLSVIVLGSLNDSRDRAQNTKKNQLAAQYNNAIEIYRSQNDTYPVFSGITENTWYCVGETADTTCHGETINYNSNLSSEIETFLPGPPADEYSVPVTNFLGTFDYKGIAYRCTELANSICNNYQLSWYLVDDAQNCSIGATATQFDTHSFCFYQQQ